MIEPLIQLERKSRTGLRFVTCRTRTSTDRLDHPLNLADAVV